MDRSSVDPGSGGIELANGRDSATVASSGRALRASSGLLTLVGAFIRSEVRPHDAVARTPVRDVDHTIWTRSLWKGHYERGSKIAVSFSVGWRP